MRVIKQGTKSHDPLRWDNCWSVGVFCNIAVKCRQDDANLFSQLSGHSNNVGKLCVTHREADEELGIRNLYRKWGSCGSSLAALKRPPMEKTVQLSSESHLDKHCEY
jgi:hypothetical protein